MKAIALLFSFVMVGVSSAEVKTPCKMPLYIEAVRSTALHPMDNTGSMFLYGLKSAVRLHQGCIVDTMTDAHLGLYITTLKIADDGGRSNASVVAVALAVPLNGLPVYMDDYVMVLRNADSIDEQVNALLQNIGETLDQYGSEKH